jgi:glycosyltransferase involved in cell wall biosynthesis
MPDSIPISVIITTYNAAETVAACLKALLAQQTETPFEVIVVDSSTDNTAEIVRSQFPAVQLHHFDERKYCGDARNFGVSVARGQLLAFTDADCTAPPDWIDSLVRSHAQPYLVIGGAIAPDPNHTLIGWAAYFSEFSRWLPGHPRYEIRDVAGANMSFKREAFARYGRFIEGTYGSDTDYHWRVTRLGGQPPLFDPSILVTHHSLNDFRRFIWHEFKHGKDFGRVRLHSQNFSIWRRGLYTVLGGLIPVKIFVHTMRNTFQSRRYVKQFMAALPLTLLGVIAWSLGEFISYAGLDLNEARLRPHTQPDSVQSL